MVDEYSNLTDEQLVEKAKNGDNKAYEMIVKRYEEKVYNLAYRLTNNRTVARDILQETFIKVYHSLKNFKKESKFSTWLYRIAMNFSLMHRRKKQYTVSLDNPIQTDDEEELKHELPDWSDNPEATIENKELRKKIYNTLELLPEKYRSVLILRDMEGLSNKEVSKILNISVPAVKARIHRSRMFVRDKLSEYFKQNYG